MTDLETVAAPIASPTEVPSDAPFVLLSRVAESAYWAGRYLERAETTARLLRCHTELFLDLPKSVGLGWWPLLAVLGTGEQFGRNHHHATEDIVVGHLAGDRRASCSIVTSLAAVHENLRVTRPVMPAEAAEVLNELHRHVDTTVDRAIERPTRIEWLTGVIRRCQTLNGLLLDTMSHDDCFSFLTIGRQLERADMTTRVLDVQAGVLMGRGGEQVEPFTDVCWASALRSLNAFDGYRRRHTGTSAETTLAFLLRDPQCPRSVEACITEAARRLLELPHHEDAMAASAAVEALLTHCDIEALVDGGLHDRVDDLQRAIGAMHEAVARTWFDVGAEPAMAGSAA